MSKKEKRDTSWLQDSAQMPQAASNMSAERVQRLKKIEPFFEMFKSGTILPGLELGPLENFPTALKDEGNDCFKEKQYLRAYDMYTSALNICRYVQIQLKQSIAPDLLSTLFSNRAACLLKMDYFKECIKDCDMAISQDEDSYKAYYRRACAYKSLRDWVSALQAAEEGRTCSLKINKSTKDFDDLIKEISCHLPAANAASNSNAASKSNSGKTGDINSAVNASNKMSAGKPSEVKQTNASNKVPVGRPSSASNKMSADKPSEVKQAKATEVKQSADKANEAKSNITQSFIQVQHSGGKADEFKQAIAKALELNPDDIKATTKAAEVKQTAAKSAAKSVEVKQTAAKSAEVKQSATKSVEVKQTAAKSAEVKQTPAVGEVKPTAGGGEGSVKSKKKAGENAEISVQQQQQKAKPAAAAVKKITEVDNSWLEGTSAVSAKPIMQPSVSKKKSKKKAMQQQQTSNYSGKYSLLEEDVGEMEEGGGGDESSSEGEGEDESTVHNVNVNMNMNGGHNMRFDQSDVGMGLDELKDFSYYGGQSKEKTSWADSVPESLDDFQPVPVRRNQPSSFSPTKISSADKSSVAGPGSVRWGSAPLSSANSDGFENDFQPIVLSNDKLKMPYPFDTMYMMTLRCEHCYKQTSHAAAGYRAYPNLMHPCSHSMLLLKKKTDLAGPWIKIRPRNTKGAPVYKYKLCKQFTSGIPCRVREDDCSYPHYDEEAALWSMDRDGLFNIVEFIHTLKSLLASEAAKANKLPENQPFHRSVIGASGKVSNRFNALADMDELNTSAENTGANKKGIKTQAVPSSTVKSILDVDFSNVDTGRSFSNSNDSLSSRQSKSSSTIERHENVNPSGAIGQQHTPRHGDGRYVNNQKLRKPLLPDPFNNQTLQPAFSNSYPPNQNEMFQNSFNPNVNRKAIPPNLPQWTGHTAMPPQMQQFYPQEHAGMYAGFNNMNYPLGFGHPREPFNIPYTTQSSYEDAYSNQLDLVEGQNYVDFPLADTCDYKLVCDKCFVPHPSIANQFILNSSLNHDCEETVLAVRHRADNVWVRVRERKIHRYFNGDHKLCRSVGSFGSSCSHAFNCLFAHNLQEQVIWTLEKDGKFNLSKFLDHVRSSATKPRFTVSFLLENYPGEFRFLCGACFVQFSQLRAQSTTNSKMCGQELHNWQESQMLFHYSREGRATAIGPRPFTHSTAYFALCRHQHYCQLRPEGRCRFAHSDIERDVWYTERDKEITQDQIVIEAQAIIILQYNSQQQQKVSAQHPQVKQQKQKDERKCASPSLVTESSDSRESVKEVAAATPPPERKVEEATNSSTCPHHVVEACSLCWQKGLISHCEPGKDRCKGTGMGHAFLQNKICILLPARKRIGQLPKKIPQNNHFVLCKQIKEKKRCDFAADGRCQFAHCNEEIDVWKWMVINKVKTLEDLVSLSQKSQEQSKPASKPISKGESVVAMRPLTLPPPNPHPFPLDLALNTHYCHYCTVHCNSIKQWDEHCASERHMFNVNSDKEHQWNYRQPPWGEHVASYVLCPRHMDGGKCCFSDVPETYNQCQSAHSQEELDEWKERWEWRQMKREMAKKGHLYSYMDALREDYETSDSGVSVISEECEGMSVSCDTTLQLYHDSKNKNYAWTFNVKTNQMRKLVRVALLYDHDRLHFSLVGSDLDRMCQIAPGESFAMTTLPSTNQLLYRVNVNFNGGIFGSFTQWVIFDFGTRPVLVKKINVELGTKIIQEKVKTLREKFAFDRWTSDNRHIVWFRSTDNATGGKAMNQLNSELMRRYKAPSSVESIVTQQSVSVDLNRHNYAHKMHQMLYLEELTQVHIMSSRQRSLFGNIHSNSHNFVSVDLNHHNYAHKMHQMLYLEELTQVHIMSRYNMQTKVKLTDEILAGGMAKALNGELFARVPLNEQLNEDTDAGKLLLSAMSTVLLAPLDESNRNVYEALLVTRDNFGITSAQGSDYKYLCLSERCCRELGLCSGQLLDVEIQFQLNRLQFCQMHYAVDQLDNADLMFPDLNRIKDKLTYHSSLQFSSNVLNDDQMKIIEYIANTSVLHKPPLVIYGPFGTGKTETLAQAAMWISTHIPDSRILICTHSNSAADVFILRHLDEFIEKFHPELKILRVYSVERRTNTVSNTVKKYCLMSGDGRHFIEPTKHELLKYQIIITTLTTSLLMLKLEMKGCFTQIFIDEAAQVHECEAVMPLSLATDSTGVVVAGDHYQMSRKVYSREARRQKFHLSLVERLFTHYQSYTHLFNRIQPSILLSINYRSRMEIVRFIAAVFYGGPDVLKSHSVQRSVDGMVPLTFYSAQGREVQDAESTSYYNVAEVEEVVDRVSHLFFNWPEEQWGERNSESILVVTPYLDQVSKIRHCLRNKHRELSQVTVERVSNIPGKEFHAVFLSTVRTRHIADDLPKVSVNTSECDGDFGDFGFLSDQKLLNSALTRAQSFVAVVGDPVALCAIGEAMSIWRAYLKHCQNLESIYPDNVTIDNIRLQVQNLWTSPAGSNLQQLSALLKQQQQEQIIEAEGESSVSIRAKRLSTASVVHSSGEETDSDQSDDKTESNTCENEMTTKGVFEDWNFDYRLEPDNIIQQLIKEGLKVSKKSALDPGSGMNAQGESPDGLKLKCVKLRERHGHAVVSLKQRAKQTVAALASRNKRSRYLLTGNESDDDDAYDSELDASSSDDDDNEGNVSMNQYIEHLPERLLEMVRHDPDRYKRCRLYIENSYSIYAKPVDASREKIKIGNYARCGRAFNHDEVVVEILNVDQEDNEALNESEKLVLQGQVVGIIRQSLNPKYRMFICYPEEDNPGLMVPLNRSIPRIYNVELNNHKKGHVTVYTFTKDRRIIFHHHEPVDICRLQSTLFIVRYLKWEPEFYAPLGVVVGVLPAGNTVENALKILNIEYFIPRKFREETLRELEYPRNFSLDRGDFVSDRSDYRDKMTFTIDPETSKDLDDAISIEELPGNKYCIGVHIADVSHFVDRGSFIDEEARTRGSTYYPVNASPILMFPERLSNDIFSLLPDKDRLTVSVVFTINSRADIENVQLKRTMIRSKYRLNYKQVEMYLQGLGTGDENETLPDELLAGLTVCHRISNIWRRRRLGNAALYHPMDADSAEAPEAHLMIEELMITANHHVAKVLVEKYPQFTPLRTQLAPDELELDEWRHIFREQARNTVSLTQPFKYRGEVCNCTEECTCIQPAEGKDYEMLVFKSVWNKIYSAVENDDLARVQSLVLDPENHPQLSVAMLRLIYLQDKAEYVNSGSVPEDHQIHYSLNISLYTHFTSPIRRYLDVAVHRLVHAYIDGKESPYTSSEINDLCIHCTDVTKNARKYENATKAIYLSNFLQTRPIAMNGVVEKVSTSNIQLKLSKSLNIPSFRCRIKVGSLAPSKQPEVNEESETMLLHWSRRIHDINPKGFSTTCAPVILNDKRFTFELPGSKWRDLMLAVVSEDKDMMIDVAGNIANLFKALEVFYSAEEQIITSEGAVLRKFKYFCEFILTLQRSSVLKVQLTAELVKGMLTPKLQLFNVADSLDVCLQHRTNPLRCFAGVSSLKAIKQSYQDVDAYKAAWLPVLAMEACHTAIQNNETVIINNVSLKWAANEQGEYKCAFLLDAAFCKLRHIQFFIDKPNKGEDDCDEKDEAELCRDYLCIRYSGIKAEPGPEELRLGDSVDWNETVTWVVHCIISDVTFVKEQKMYYIEAKVHHCDMPIPDAILHASPLPHATVELISKPLPIRRMESAVWKLESASPLAQQIALHGRTDPLSDVYLNEANKWKLYEIPGMSSPNVGQKEAISRSLTQAFTLIHGPPGTGKSMVTGRIIHLFVQINASLPRDLIKGRIPQVLCCGPSNKSVDVIAKYLLNMGRKCPKVVRIYGETTEFLDYPIRNNLSSCSRKVIQSNPELKDITLHHKIRTLEGSVSESVRAMDERIRKASDDDNIDPEEIAIYRNNVKFLMSDEIKSAEVILCTCSTSSNRILKENSNIYQVLIDESGMCTEAECMIPIVNSRANQVVLVGDHQQLQPIIMERTAKNRGLDRSLFARYWKRAVKLTTQYRMHESIAEFPSVQFYDGTLEVGTEEQTKSSALKFWPNGRNKPIAFVHVMGCEEVMTVATDEGNEQSRSNQREVETAVRAANQLVRRFHVRPQDVAVLTQYKAQSSEIEKELIKKGEKDICVSTIVTAQGSEWDYVIISTVRSLPKSQIEKKPSRAWKNRNLGFITDSHQINVALTRAKKGIIIIGNKYLLECDEMWKKLLQHYSNNKKLVDAAEFMPY